MSFSEHPVREDMMLTCVTTGCIVLCCRCDTSPQTWHHRTTPSFLSHSFCSLEGQAECGWAPRSGSPKATIEVSAGLCSQLELVVLFQLIHVVGRIQDGLFSCRLAAGLTLSSQKLFSNSHWWLLHLQGQQENFPPLKSLSHFESLTSRPRFKRLI